MCGVVKKFDQTREEKRQRRDLKKSRYPPTQWLIYCATTAPSLTHHHIVHLIMTQKQQYLYSLEFAGKLCTINGYYYYEGWLMLDLCSSGSGGRGGGGRGGGGW